MIKGIGIDMVEISRMEKLLTRFSKEALLHMFTADEVEIGLTKSKPAEYFATRFAAKEAVFKALAPLTQKKSFDLRIVETLNHEDGSPYVHIREPLQEVMDAGEVSALLISITTEGAYATAYVIAQ